MRIDNKGEEEEETKEKRPSTKSVKLVFKI